MRFKWPIAGICCNNLTEALQRAVDRQPAMLGEAAKDAAATLAPSPIPAPRQSLETPAVLPPPQLSRAQQKKQNSRTRRMARYQQVQELVLQGMSLRKIRLALKMSRNTVERFARCQQFPERAMPTPAPIAIDPYLPFLKQRWDEGCNNVAQLWEQIKANDPPANHPSLGAPDRLAGPGPCT
jgi:hypothetical protein